MVRSSWLLTPLRSSFPLLMCPLPEQVSENPPSSFLAQRQDLNETVMEDAILRNQCRTAIEQPEDKGGWAKGVSPSPPSRPAFNLNPGKARTLSLPMSHHSFDDRRMERGKSIARLRSTKPGIAPPEGWAPMCRPLPWTRRWIADRGIGAQRPHALSGMTRAAVCTHPTHSTGLTAWGLYV